MAKSVRCFAVVVALANSIASASADPKMSVEPSPEQYSALYDYPADDHDAASARIVAFCQTMNCAADWDIEEAFDALDERNRPNTMARLPPWPEPAEAKRRAERRIRRAILAHPWRMSAYCAIITAIATNYSDIDYDMSFKSLELALRMTRPGFDCLARVLASLPRIGESDILLQASRSSNCALKLKGCERIVRPP